MRIAFDVDGVLRELDISRIHLFQKLEKIDPTVWDAWEVYCYRDAKPLLNPILFSLPEDELFALSTCKDQKEAELKREWLLFYYGNRIELYPVFNDYNSDSWKKNWVDAVVQRKLPVLYMLDADIYFDDDPAVIRKMRETNLKDIENGIAKKRIVFIKYGNWIREWY